MCLPCAKKFITQRVIDQVVAENIEKKRIREEKKQRQDNK